MTEELQLEEPSEEHTALFDDISALINAYPLPWPDTMAVLANMLGKLIAAVPPEEASLAREIASSNIRFGIEAGSGIVVLPIRHDA